MLESEELLRLRQKNMHNGSLTKIPHVVMECSECGAIGWIDFEQFSNDITIECRSCNWSGLFLSTEDPGWATF